MNKKERALKILKILKREYSKYQKPLSTSIQHKTKDPFKVLIATILSARAKDTQTEKISFELFKTTDTPKKLAKIETKKLEKIIKSIGFYKEKSRRIKNAAQYILDHHKGKVPKTRDELMKIPGVGRKTANVFLSELGGDAIGIDTHVSYCSQKLGWTKNHKPEKIEEDLKKMFSKNNWNKVNSSLVRFGKTYTSKKEKDSLLEEIKKIK